MAANLVRGKLAAVFLGTTGVGVYNQLALTSNLAALSGSLASNNGLIQHGAEALGEKDDQAFASLVATMVMAVGVASVAIGLSGTLAAPWLSHALLDDHGRHWREVALVIAATPLFVFATLTRGLLGASRAVRQLVRVQILSELSGAAIFALLVFPFGLIGALIGLISVQAIGLAAALISLARLHGWSVLFPRRRRLRLPVLRSNLAFGASGFLMVAFGNLSLIAVNRLIIGTLSLGAAGIFANAVRLSNVYLGAVTATALNHYLPTVTALKDSRLVGAEANKVLTFYGLILPPIMAAIVILAPWIIPVIFSGAFLAAVPLVAILVPAELARVIGESLSVPLLARRRLVAHTLLYVGQVVLFVALAVTLVPRVGLIGAAVAYAVGACTYALAAALTARQLVGITIERRTAGTLARAIMLLAAVVGALMLLAPVTSLAVGSIAIALWAILSYRSPELRQNIRQFLRRDAAPTARG